MLLAMTQSDRLIPDNAKCATCTGVGWTWWAGSTEPEQEGKWIVCRECIGTGRKDHKGRKRLKPEDAPSS
jgi:DnaJ-class molecular chaperone